MSSASAFGRVVRQARKKRNLSQEELAGRSGLHRNAIGLVERGERSPSLDTVLAIADGLEISAATLVSRVDKARSKQK